MPLDLRFSVLGPVRAQLRGSEIDMGQPRQRAVLASLLLRGGSSVTVAELVDDLWGEDPPASAVGSIRTYVYRLRRQLDLSGLCQLKSVNGGYVLKRGPESLDLDLFRRLVLQARAARGSGDLSSAAGHYAEALTLWAGPALAGVPGPHAQAQRTLLGELRLGSVEERLACDIELGIFAQSAAELSALVHEYPLRERFTELMMTALYGAGRQSDALLAFQSTSRLLRETLGVSPSPALQRIHQLILTNELALAPASTGASPQGQPSESVGARIASPAQLPAAVPHMVGREPELRHFAQIVREQSATPAMAVCVVSGPFGVGKTALAVRMAREVATQYPDGQLFADLGWFGPTGQKRETGQVLAEFIEALGVPASAVPAGTGARATLFRGLLADRRVLVLLDNVSSAGQVRPLLPGGDQCLALITSRNQLPGLIATHEAVPYPLRPLQRDDARRLLVHRLGRHRAEEEASAIEGIIDFCGLLPLSLSVVAARATYRANCPLEVLAAELREGGRLDALADVDPVLDARTALTWSYEALDQRSARLMRFLALHTGPDVTVGEAAALIGDTAHGAHSLLDRLANAGMLVEHLPARFTVDCLVREFAGELLRVWDSAAECEAASLRLRAHQRSGSVREATPGQPYQPVRLGSLAGMIPILSRAHERRPGAGTVA